VMVWLFIMLSFRGCESVVQCR